MTALLLGTADAVHPDCGLLVLCVRKHQNTTSVVPWCTSAQHFSPGIPPWRRRTHHGMVRELFVQIFAKSRDLQHDCAQGALSDEQTFSTHAALSHQNSSASRLPRRTSTCEPPSMITRGRIARYGIATGRFGAQSAQERAPAEHFASSGSTGDLLPNVSCPATTHAIWIQARLLTSTEEFLKPLRSKRATTWDESDRPSKKSLSAKIQGPRRLCVLFI